MKKYECIFINNVELSGAKCKHDQCPVIFFLVAFKKKIAFIGYMKKYECIFMNNVESSGAKCKHDRCPVICDKLLKTTVS